MLIYEFLQYFTFLTVTTNTLGGVAPQHLNLFFLNMCIFLGLGLVSMTISIVQQHIEHLIRRVQRDIEKAYQEKLLIESGQMEAPEGRDPDAVINDILKKNNAPGWLSSLISDKQRTELVEKVEEKAAMINVEIQVEPEPIPTQSTATKMTPLPPRKIEHLEIQAQLDLPPEMLDSQEQTSPRCEMSASQSQTEFIAVKDMTIQANLKPPVREVSTGSFKKQCRMIEAQTQTLPYEPSEQAIQAKAEQKTVGLQTATAFTGRAPWRY